MPKAKKLLLSIGYEVLHESEDVVNFKSALRELGQIDFYWPTAATPRTC